MTEIDQAEPAKTAVHLDNVSFAFTNNPILSEFDLTLREGEILALVGPSGVGKSTILNLIAGVELPNSGSIKFESASSANSMAMVLQSPTLIPWRNIIDNVLIALELTSRKVTPLDRLDAERLLESVGLPEEGRQYPYQLSGGMQQRAAFARALISNPCILLLDEPFSNLDFVSRAMLRLTVMQYRDTSGSSIILVTHDLEDAVRLADRIIVLGGSPLSISDEIPIAEPTRDRVTDNGQNDDLIARYRRKIWNSMQ